MKYKKFELNDQFMCHVNENYTEYWQYFLSELQTLKKGRRIYEQKCIKNWKDKGMSGKQLVLMKIF